MNKKRVFIGYTFLIYILGYIIAVIVLILNGYIIIFFDIFKILLTISLILINQFSNFIAEDSNILHIILYSNFLGFIFAYCIAFYMIPVLPWYSKQTISRAWLMSVLAFVIGPGFVFLRSHMWKALI